jgi:hypothetical protein
MLCRAKNCTKTLVAVCVTLGIIYITYHPLNQGGQNVVRDQFSPVHYHTKDTFNNMRLIPGGTSR